jgi:Fe-S cluster biogenesis protein NfuA
MPSTLETQVRAALDEVQPMLGLHGGAIELVEITPDNIVRVRFKGACEGCMAADYTLEYGLKEYLLMKIEGIEDVEAVNDEPKTHMPPSIPLTMPAR